MNEAMRDAAYATNISSDWQGVVGGYLDSRQAFHVWSESDWKRFDGNRKLPIFVATDDGYTDAWDTIEQLYMLGVPIGSRVAYDMEGRVDKDLVGHFGGILVWAGFKPWVYGSASTVFGNPSLDGYWVADYVASRPPEPFMYGHPEVRGTQYTDNPPADEYDSSTIHPSLLVSNRHWWV